MSLEQAFSLLDQEVKAGKYKMPLLAQLTPKERTLKLSNIDPKAAITKSHLHGFTLAKPNEIYKGRCYQLPVKIIYKKLTMVCYLQNLTLNEHQFKLLRARQQLLRQQKT